MFIICCFTVSSVVGFILLKFSSAIKKNLASDSINSFSATMQNLNFVSVS
jgi:hypothetical protein